MKTDITYPQFFDLLASQEFARFAWYKSSQSRFRLTLVFILFILCGVLQWRQRGYSLSEPFTYYAGVLFGCILVFWLFYLTLVELPWRRSALLLQKAFASAVLDDKKGVTFELSQEGVRLSGKLFSLFIPWTKIDSVVIGHHAYYFSNKSFSTLFARIPIEAVSSLQLCDEIPKTVFLYHI